MVGWWEEDRGLQIGELLRVPDAWEGVEARDGHHGGVGARDAKCAGTTGNTIERLINGPCGTLIIMKKKLYYSAYSDSLRTNNFRENWIHGVDRQSTCDSEF